MIRTIQINGFKSIHEMSLELGTVNCFIGANGVGKSNILEAIGVLGAAANGAVDDEALLRRGVRPGLPRLYNSAFAKVGEPAHIGLAATGEKQECYRVSLQNPLDNPEAAWSFQTEMLGDGQDEIVADGARKLKNLSPKAGLAALKIVDIPVGNAAAELMWRLQNYAIYSPNTPALRGMTMDPQSRAPVGLAGGRLAEGFADLRKRLQEDLFDDVVELVDWVSEIDVATNYGALLSPSVPSTSLVLKFTDRFMDKSHNELTAYDASEGALYVLFCALLCLSPHSPELFAVDNLDQALNPRLAAKLVGKLGGWLSRVRQTAPRVLEMLGEPKGEPIMRQLLFTAHNPAVLDGLDLENPEIRLFAVERSNKGHTCVHRVKMTPELAKLNEEYPLSRLWMMGHLGAVPNV